MARRAMFNDKGEIIGEYDESERIEAIQEVENDPYWKSRVPHSERKHKRPARINWSGGKVAIVAVTGIVILGLLYYIVIQMMEM